jgi:3-hydroxy-9,10-secoandrosta-1,3,5(10)-triene-9,17-dione monooxygenase reductase component
MIVEIEEFKNAAASFSTGVCVCIVEQEKSQFVGITINSFASLSLNPCLIMFSLKKQSRFHGILLGKKHFAINVLSYQQKAIATHFSKNAGSIVEENQLIVNSNNPIPFLIDCCANMHCELFCTYDGGDHTIVVGLVENVIYSPLTPLVYFLRNFHSLSESV